DLPGFPVQVVNSVGAGDAFLGGFLAAWLRDLPLSECARWGNACGAIVVSRHGCTPAMPYMREVEYFLVNYERLQRPSDDAMLLSLHRSPGASRRDRLYILAFDHRWQLEELAAPLRAIERLPRLKDLIYDAFASQAGGRDDTGILVDATYGKSVLE